MTFWLHNGLAVMFLAGCLGCELSSNPTIADESTSEQLQGFAVVELFTSQGCSSCPSADRNLARIAGNATKHNLDIYTLSFHVDYWNRLGWKDPFSSAEATRRQQSYARHFGSSSVYTPQMIVNGTVEFVGSKVDSSRAAIGNALRQKRTGTVRITPSLRDKKIVVDYQTTGVTAEDWIHCVLVQKNAARNVTSGENSGRSLAHVNVVREFKTADADQKGKLELKWPAGLMPEECHVIAFLQNSVTKSIHAATRSKIVD